MEKLVERVKALVEEIKKRDTVTDNEETLCISWGGTGWPPEHQDWLRIFNSPNGEIVDVRGHWYANQIWGKVYLDAPEKSWFWEWYGNQRWEREGKEAVEKVVKWLELQIEADG